jgi:hypothetical protein
VTCPSIVLVIMTSLENSPYVVRVSKGIPRAAPSPREGPAVAFWVNKGVGPGGDWRVSVLGLVGVVSGGVS